MTLTAGRYLLPSCCKFLRNTCNSRASPLAYTPSASEVCKVCICSEDARVSASVFQGLNAFLLHHGCDVASSAAELHVAAGPVVRRVLAEPRASWLAEAVHTYLRIQLRLGALQVRRMESCHM